MLLASWEVRMVKNYDRSLENAARGQHFQDRGHSFFKLRTDSKLANNVFIVFLTLSNQCYDSFTSNHKNMSRFGKLTDVVKKNFFSVVL